MGETEGWTVCYSHYVKKNDEAMDHTTVARSELWLIRGSGVGVLEEFPFARVACLINSVYVF